MICRYRRGTEAPRLGARTNEGSIFDLDELFPDRFQGLADVLDALGVEAGLVSAIEYAVTSARAVTGEVRLCAPIDEQEVWAAGVTYRRSADAREDESHGSGVYDRVYNAERPEVFFKATPHRVVASGETLWFRADSTWNVPEPELALVLSSSLQLVGVTVGNDMSSRSIEGDNPLYLPQAKVYDRCCSLGPVIVPITSIDDPANLPISLIIRRRGEVVFSGESSTAAMKRTFPELIACVGRHNSFPKGAFLLTGTGIVPPDTFTLADGDEMTIAIDGVGTLTNRAERAPA